MSCSGKIISLVQCSSVLCYTGKLVFRSKAIDGVQIEPHEVLASSGGMCPAASGRGTLGLVASGTSAGPYAASSY